VVLSKAETDSKLVSAPSGRFVFIENDPIEGPVDTSASQRESKIKLVELPPPLSDLPLPLSLRRDAVMARFAGKNNGRKNGWQNYTVRLASTGVLSSSVTGVVAQSFECDPSASSLPEWSTFAGLFDEVKCVGFEVRLCPYFDINSVGSVITRLYVGSFTRTVATPSSSTLVAVAPDSEQLNPLMTSTLGHRHVMKYPTDILYAATSTPTAGPYAGCPGSIQVYSDANSNSIALWAYMVVGHYALRGRL
jgi:hypothetical protein